MTREPVDLEELARTLLRSKMTDAEVLQRVSEASDSGHWARAILAEVRSTEVLEGVVTKDLRAILTTPTAGATAGETGLGCRGEGDFHFHSKIAEIAGEGGVIGVPQLDDSGVVRLPSRRKEGKRARGDLIAVAVDGVHSRLDHFPFLMGFHVARAALRDIVVSGARPLAMFSDVHIGNDGDVGKILDFTAGITTVGEALGVPLVAGSTLRIGGDMVLGGRLTGCVGGIGLVEHLTPRGGIRRGDLLIMTEGKGGGTIATAALFNGKGEVAARTFNLDTIRAGLQLLGSKVMRKVHSMTDVTNGGIRGDAFHMASSSDVRIVLDEAAFRGLVDPDVLSLLDGLDIDPMGVSVDSMLLAVGPRSEGQVLEMFAGLGLRAARVGKAGKGKGVGLVLEDGGKEELSVRFREAPYTPIKKLVDQPEVPPAIRSEMRRKVDEAAKEAVKKKRLALGILGRDEARKGTAEEVAGKEG